MGNVRMVTEKISAEATDHLADFTQDKRILLLSAMAVFIGVLSAGVAKALLWLIALISNWVFYQQFSPVLIPVTHHHLGAWVIVAPAIGGLIIGLMARYGSEKIRGHGIPEALEAILFGRSRMDPKVAVLKPVSSAISIGTGGPFGAEGPIIMTGGAAGSLFAQLFHLSSAERKILLVAGAAAGMSAIFATPIAAVMLAVELLLFEWRPRSFIPVALASAVAAMLRVYLMGNGPIFPVIAHAAPSPEILFFALITGIIAGLCASLLTAWLYGCEDFFHKLPLHWMWWPMLGGLVVGLIGWWDPRALGVGYELIHALLQGRLTGLTALSLMFSKAAAWSVALGSGTSGGVLAPLLMIGGALGALESSIIPFGDPGLWATLGMSAMMGGTMGCPLTAMIFALELTQDIHLLLPLLVACTGAHLVIVFLMRRSILTEKIARRGYHIMREYSVDALSMIRVNEAMDKHVVCIPDSMLVQELAGKFSRHDRQITRHHGIPILDSQAQLVGMITQGDLLLALEKDAEGKMTVLEAGSRNVIVTYPDETLSQALEKLVRYNIGRLPVVSRSMPNKVVGYLGRSAIISSRTKWFEEEHQRDPGWLSMVCIPRKFKKIV